MRDPKISYRVLRYEAFRRWQGRPASDNGANDRVVEGSQLEKQNPYKWTVVICPLRGHDQQGLLCTARQFGDSFAIRSRVRMVELSKPRIVSESLHLGIVLIREQLAEI